MYRSVSTSTQCTDGIF
jgi:MFS family permease